MSLRKIVSFFVFGFCSGIYVNAQSDTIKIHDLPAVEVNETQRLPISNLATSPQQILSKEHFEKTGAFQITDAIKFFSGVQVKDYGGTGGLKTVSLRNMGANYTTVVYDGIPMTNYMTGQIDLGRFSLENVEMLRLNIGESDDIFQPAGTLALGGSLNIFTQPLGTRPVKKREFNVGLKTGSYGLINPVFAFRSSFNERFSTNASVEYISSKGNYSYKQTYGFRNDSIASKRRINSDVETLKLEANLNGHFKNGGRLLLKVFYFDSERGIPGPSIFYNPENAGERIQDKNFFSQANYTQPLNKKWRFQSNAKFDFSSMDYQNKKWNSQGNYDQNEYYLNAAFLYKPTDRLSFSFSNDGIYGKFDHDTIHVSRVTWLSALSGKYQTSRLIVTGSLLNHYVSDSNNNSDKKSTGNHFSPYIGLSVRPFEERSLRIRAFYKNSYRLPTFGDLYYSSVARNLKPENANQYNVGIVVNRSQGIIFPYFSFSIYAYYNKVENKIVIGPGPNHFNSSVRNHGEVNIKGFDVGLEFHVNVSQDIIAEISGNYSYQNVLDKKDQKELILPYTPKHSASGHLSFKTKWLNVNYNFICSGERYYIQTEETEYRMKPYSDHGISLIKQMDWKQFNVHLSAECLNIYNQQYEIVRSYPMPGRSFRLGVKFTF
ncbi:MAG: TonB-dependent receptor [Dysgonamonadaceae bacterium]|jgi:outer membrane cobalamin receptor|nr:TonB-dependent receptor [Dysgonamonadaceae bacterium]